jgi:hypothetical protein
LRLLAYGTAADSVLDENLEISEIVALDALTKFAEIVVEKFVPEYLNRCPTEEGKKELCHNEEPRLAWGFYFVGL